MPTKKVSEILELLARDGWFQVKAKGGHRQFKHLRKPGRVTVSGKPSETLAPGTLNSSEASGPEGAALMRYTVVIEKAGSNYSAFVPDLPGCVATGRTPAAVAKRIRGAIALHLEGMREDGERIPRPSARSILVPVPSVPQRRTKKNAA